MEHWPMFHCKTNIIYFIVWKSECYQYFAHYIYCKNDGTPPPPVVKYCLFRVLSDERTSNYCLYQRSTVNMYDAKWTSYGRWMIPLENAIRNVSTFILSCYCTIKIDKARLMKYNNNMFWHFIWNLNFIYSITLPLSPSIQFYVITSL